MKRLIFFSVFIVWLAMPEFAIAKDEPKGDPITVGYLEKITVGKLGLEMVGKLDTGADTSSIHAYDMDVYKRGKKDHWVRFRLIGKNNRIIRFDQNVIRFVHIKVKTGGTIRRPVIRLPLCVGGASGRAEINLADRGDFHYDILIGREFMAGRILVDSGNSFIANNDCGKGE